MSSSSAVKGPPTTRSHGARVRRLVCDHLTASNAGKRLAAQQVVPGGSPLVRELLQELGDRRLLAPGWPVEFGGRGLAPSATWDVAMELALHGVPDGLHTVAVSTVGNLILKKGTAEQQRQFLPPIAAGRLFAVAAYSELGAGSDLSRMTTEATLKSDRWLLNGGKRYSQFAALARLGLCAARMDARSANGAVGLFLFDLTSENVSIRTFGSVLTDDFDEITLSGVEAVPIGGLNGDFGETILEALSLERTGIEAQGRARRWLDSAISLLDVGGVGAPARLPDRIQRIDSRISVAGVVAEDVLRRIDADLPYNDAASASKWLNSIVATEAADFLVEVAHSVGTSGPDVDAVIDSVDTDASAITLSGGASEVLLQSLAAKKYQVGAAWTASVRTFPDAAIRVAEVVAQTIQDYGREEVFKAFSPAAVGEAARDVRGRVWTDLVEWGATLFAVPAARGGLDLGLGSETLVAATMGRYFCRVPFVETLLYRDAVYSGSVAGYVHDPASDLPVVRYAFDTLAIGSAVAGRRGTQRERLKLGGITFGRDAESIMFMPDGGRQMVVTADDPRLIWERAGPRSDASMHYGLLVGPIGIGSIGGSRNDDFDLWLRSALRQSAYVIGLIQGALETASARVDDRVVFGHRLSQYQTVSFQLTRLGIEVAGALALIRDAAEGLDVGSHLQVFQACSFVKNLCRTARRSLLHLHGASGLQRTSLGLSGHAPVIRTEGLRLKAMLNSAGTSSQSLGFPGHRIPESLLYNFA